MRLLTKTAAAAVVLAGLGMVVAPVANAVPQTVTFNLAFSTGQGPAFTPTDYNFNTLFPEFNPAAFGVLPSALTGVFISVTGKSSGTVNFFDSVPGGGGGGVLIGGGVNPTKAGVALQIKTPDATILLPTPTTSLVASVAIPANSVAGGPTSFTFGLGGSDTQTETVAAANFATFIGVGNISTPGGVCPSGIIAQSPNSACSFVVTNSTGNVGSLPNITANETGFITYSYDDGVKPSPEPASMALLGAGLAGLGLIRRRNRR